MHTHTHTLSLINQKLNGGIFLLHKTPHRIWRRRHNINVFQMATDLTWASYGLQQHATIATTTSTTAVSATKTCANKYNYGWDSRMLKWFLFMTLKATTTTTTKITTFVIVARSHNCCKNKKEKFGNILNTIIKRNKYWKE